MSPIRDSISSLFANLFDRKSLTDLDLRKNHLLEVRNLHCLPQLQHLNLGMFFGCYVCWDITNDTQMTMR